MSVLVGILRVLVAVALLSAPLSYAKVASDLAPLNQNSQAEAKLSVAIAARVQGRNDEARKSYEDARRLFQVERNHLGEANALLGLGELERKLGRNEEARKRYEDAQRLYQAEKNRLGEANVLLGLGELERSLGRNDDARKNFSDAAIYFGLAGLPDEQREAQALSRFSDVRVYWMAYRTRSGDRIEALAERFGTSVAALKSVNGITSDAPTLPPGYHLLVPSDGSSEDALGSIPVSDLPGSSYVWWNSWQSWGAVALGVLGVFVALRWWQGRKRATSTTPLSATFITADAGKQWLHYRHDAATAVVFVHGILSNPSGFRFDHKTSWAELLRDDPRANEPNVFLGQYYTAPDTGIFDMPAASEELRVQLNTPTANGKPAPLTSKRIVFIAHSTGGLVVRDLLTRHPELFKGKQVGLALIASPSRGSAWANRLSMFIDLANNRMARQLQKGNEWTDDLDKRFAEFEYKSDEARGFSIKGIDLFENRFVVGNYPIIRYLIPTRTIVVSERDSASYFGAGKIVPDTDHFSIAKPSSFEHASHRYLMEWWVRCAW